MPYTDKLNADAQVTAEEAIAALVMERLRQMVASRCSHSADDEVITPDEQMAYRLTTGIEEWAGDLGRDILHQVLAEFRPDLMDTPEGNGNYYRYTLLVTVLTDKPLKGDEDLIDIANEISDGGDMGEWEIARTERLNPCQTVQAELVLGGDGTFMLGEEAWKYQLRAGDEVWINKGQPESTGSVIIDSIVYDYANDSYTIRTDEGEEIVGHCSELYDHDWLADEEQRRDEKHGLYPEHDDPAN